MEVSCVLYIFGYMGQYCPPFGYVSLSWVSVICNQHILSDTTARHFIHGSFSSDLHRVDSGGTATFHVIFRD